MRISHSKVELYNQCSMKFKLRYLDKIEANKTPSALLMGSAIDKALNYVLIRTKRHHPVYVDTAKAIFDKNMSKWYGQNELSFFKNEIPDGVEHLSGLELEQAVHAHLCRVGHKMLELYVKDILPQFAEILSVQTKREIPNEEGDVLVLVTDFTAKLHDGRVVIFDNKTASDIKRQYPKSAVVKSQQLAIYSEFEPSKLAGYIAMQKKLVNDEVIYTIVVDEVPEEQVELAFNKVDDALRNIKAGNFSCNPKSCFAFGKPCEYRDYCNSGSMKGLIKKS